MDYMRMRYLQHPSPLTLSQGRGKIGMKIFNI